jgi:multidrug efflux system membrane fusion protein
MRTSRWVAAGLVLGAVVWIGSGHFGEKAPKAQDAAKTQKVEKRFRVTVVPAVVEDRVQRLSVSGRTEADRRTNVTARTNGFVAELRVRRGTAVKEGEVIAVLSDEAREANVQQAQARLDQRRKEYDARRALVEQGNLPRLNLAQFEADLKGAEAALAAAEAERDRGIVVSPLDGVVNELPVELGQALQPGAPIAAVIAREPMLAVVEVSERRIGGVRVGDFADVRLATGRTAEGKVRFVSARATAQTRTYRVDIEIPNADGTIPDGITAEVGLRLAAVPATRVQRSALTFSSEGRLGVRLAGEGDKVVFAPVGLVEDETEFLWVSGLKDGDRIIVQGQDFVKEGQVVDVVPAPKA